jgi:hypothetical protein
VRIVLATVVRDEADVIDANLAFHLSAGVDFVVALDNGSSDGTTEILREYERAGVLRLIRWPDADLRRADALTAVARLAATEHGADWVVSCDADQFCWPRGGTLREVLAAVPPRYGVLEAVRRIFVPRAETSETSQHFAERMIVRLAPQAALNDPANPFRAQSNVVYRAHEHVVVHAGSRGVTGIPYRPLRTWHPVEVLHFPLRSLEQCERKYVHARPDWRRSAWRARAVVARREARLHQFFSRLLVDDDELERGLACGALVVDVRLRDALRRLGGGQAPLGPSVLSRGALSFAAPTLAEEAEHALDLAVLRQADTIRARRRLDELARRLAPPDDRGRVARVT